MNTKKIIEQYLKYGNYPFEHGTQVVSILKLVTEDKDIIQAGLLHDVLEDTPVTRLELEKITNVRVARLVWEMTKTGSNEFKNLHSRDAILIKFADRLSNIANIHLKEAADIQKFLDKSVFWKQ